MKKIILIILLLLVTFTVVAAEVDYQNYFASTFPNAQTEVVLDDGSRADIVTDYYAIEVDYAYKWAESVGQSLLYGHLTGKLPGILLILEGRESYDIYLHRLLVLYNHGPFTIWTIDTEYNVKLFRKGETTDNRNMFPSLQPGDFNGDNRTSIVDALIIARYAVGMIETLDVVNDTPITIYFPDSALRNYFWSNGITRNIDLHYRVEVIGLPDQNIKSLTGLEYAKNLEFLYIYQNSISDLSPVMHLKSLKEIDLTDNDLSVLPYDFSALTSLETLVISDNDVTDITPLLTLPHSVTHVELAGNPCFTRLYIAVTQYVISELRARGIDVGVSAGY